MSIHKKKIGILGAGQLARMLALKARQMGLETLVLCEKKTDPAALVAHSLKIGRLFSEKDLNAFFSEVDIITFESEFIPSALLKKSIQSIRGRKFHPSLAILHRLQDRLLQKEWLLDFEIPSLEHVKINSKEDIQLAFHAFDQKIVFKRRLGGYDGYGTHIVKNLTELETFKNSIKGEEHQFIIEPFKEFKSERSLLFARSANKEVVVLPMVTSVQTQNQCDYVFGPTTHPQQKKMTSKIIQFLNQIDYVGVIAFELFEIGSQLIVNEVAPRVHNTGHFSQEALNIDQFELHLRCLMGMPLPEIKLKQKAFVMTNLIGKTKRQVFIKKMPTGALHWYDKLQNRPKRKMGHINYIGENQKNILELALKERKGIVL